VKIVFDSSQVSLGQLLKVFFSVAHDPTELNRQGPDVGTQYRSAVFYTTEAQRKVVDAYIAQLTKVQGVQGSDRHAGRAAQGVLRAEGYHQNYYNLHPNQPYIVINDRPKVEALKTQFAQPGAIDRPPRWPGPAARRARDTERGAADIASDRTRALSRRRAGARLDDPIG
jgi:peptide-methionine (S)-S-oxide reductase